jgi:hypothetical protein
MLRGTEEVGFLWISFPFRLRFTEQPLKSELSIGEHPEVETSVDRYRLNEPAS